jgi:CMP-N-acetylneuraminic acid synthetase
MQFLITICARGGSKGIPGKNIRKLGGKPLIFYSLDHAKSFLSHYNGDIAISTDSESIVELAEQYGIKTKYRRPYELATDKAGKIGAIDHVLNYYESSFSRKYDYVLDLDITSPLRTVDDLLQAFNILQSNPSAVNLFSVSPARKNPYFNMVEERTDGFVKLIKNTGNILSRQSAPKVYDMNASFYFYRREYFEKEYQIAITDSSLPYLIEHVCFDLDEELDFEIMEYLIQNNKLDFKL